MVTQAKVNTLKILKKASKENDAPIWAKVADFVQKSRSKKPVPDPSGHLPECPDPEDDDGDIFSITVSGLRSTFTM